MKRILTISILINLCFFAFLGYKIYQRIGTEDPKPKIVVLKEKIIKEKVNWYYKNYRHWKETKLLYDLLPNDSNEIIFLGNSITYGCDWSELLSNSNIKNRGIISDNTDGILARLNEITESKPDKIFFNIGINDLALDMRISEIVKNYEEILDQIKQSSPKTKVYIQNVLPTNNRPLCSNDTISVLNKHLEILANKKTIKYINLHDRFLNEKGKLDMKLSIDGLHLNSEGYLIWKEIVAYDVNN
jgi:lysophospholipase L1-like esterase